MISCRPSSGPARPLIAIRWYDLQRVLLGCVAPGTVELGRRFVSAQQQGPDGVHVNLEVLRLSLLDILLEAQ